MKFLFLMLAICCSCVFWTFSAQAEDDEVPIVLREPAAAKKRPKKALILDDSARIDSVVDHKTVKAITHTSVWVIGETVMVESQSPGIGVVGFLDVLDVVNNQDGTWTITCELVRASRTGFIQVGDRILPLDLSTDNNSYTGTTDLIIRSRSRSVSSRYKPLFTQGVAVGETAETLWEGEFLTHWFGLMSYGVTDKLSATTVLPLMVTGSYNLTAKYRFYSSDSTVLATGLAFAKIPNEPRATLNLNFYWDSISNSSTISHTFVTLSLATFEQAEDVTAIKALGTSSFQTGYEFILSNWDRVLLGPTYNFEKKAIGGYLSYLMVWDKFHLGGTISSTNVSSFKFSTSDGYYLAADAYWRF
jgi:hypothetical protein